MCTRQATLWLKLFELTKEDSAGTRNSGTNPASNRPARIKPHRSRWLVGQAETNPERSCRLWGLRNTVNQFASKRYAFNCLFGTYRAPATKIFFPFSNIHEPRNHPN